MSEELLAIEGAGACVIGAGERADPTPYLAEPKTRKYMSAQDEMAVVAAARALASAGVERGSLGARTGLYLTVGHIPFEHDDIAKVVESSMDQGEFSLARFTREGWQRGRPLVAFRCLPNMPAFHVSATFGIEGPCVVLYPGVGQLYLALDAAHDALARGDIDRALVGGVTHQRNFLVEHHFERVVPSVPKERLGNAAAFLVMSRDERARVRREHVELQYQPVDPRVDSVVPEELFSLDSAPVERTHEHGCASLPLALATAMERGGPFVLEHRVAARDGIRASSRWSAR